MATPGHDPRELPVDHLADRSEAPIQVLPFADMAVGEGAAEDRRAPHRHDYHELVWVRDGRREHCSTASRCRCARTRVTLIGRGQVHVFERARGVNGAVIRFDEEVLRRRRGPAGRPGLAAVGPRRAHGAGAARRGGPRWRPRIATLAAETHRPPRRLHADLQRHLCRAADLARALVRRRRTPSAARPTTPSCSSTAASPRARARLRPPPRRRPLRRRAGRARRPRSPGRWPRPPAVDQGADHGPRDDSRRRGCCASPT